MTSKRLYRSKDDRMLAGVCGGIAEVYDLDPVLIRLLAIIFLFSSFGTAVFIYVAAAIIIPPEDVVKEKMNKEEGLEDTEKVYACEECGKEFDSKQGLKVHKGQKH